MLDSSEMIKSADDAEFSDACLVMLGNEAENVTVNMFWGDLIIVCRHDDGQNYARLIQSKRWNGEFTVAYQDGAVLRLNISDADCHLEDINRSPVQENSVSLNAEVPCVTSDENEQLKPPANYFGSR